MGSAWASLVALMGHHIRKSKGKPSSRKPSSSHGKRKIRRPGERKKVEPRLHREAEPLLSDIGKPEFSPFVPDPFQEEAVEKVREHDVLVSAPTGSGKTWIALEATKEHLSRGRRIWYATPLKALSNSKYEEFGTAFGPENVGILTGDRKENADAPVIVGTTEILRNQLYDSMETGTDLGVDLVILDEAHYLGDPDRGVVWEEVLIYLPGRVRLLLLSATISNANRLAQWLTGLRKTPCAVVRSDVRPVPLHVLFMTPDRELTPFTRGGRLFPSVGRFAKLERTRRKFDRSGEHDPDGIVQTLRCFELLPAIVFLKSRADCDKAIEALSPSPMHPAEGGFLEHVKGLLEDHPELRNRDQINSLLECRAGSHHAGQLPAWRLLIERMMGLGQLEVIFSTSTVAAGVNFPARTVVLLQSDRFDGRSFVDMTATGLHQMTGRAGRRGMDKTGFTVVVPGRFMKLSLVNQLVNSDPEPLQSRIAVNFSMTLNLLLSHDPAGVRTLLGLSFAGFHENRRKAERVHKKLIKTFRKHMNVLMELDYVDETGAPTYDGRWAARLRLDHPLLIAELIREGAFRNLTPRELAALIAPFVVDKDREISLSHHLWEMTRPLWKRFRWMMKTLSPLMGFMVSRGFEVPPIMFWPAAAVFLWSSEAEWDELALHVGAQEGDLAMMMLRTADHLRQLRALEDEEPDMADAAGSALPLIMRPPLT